jgi:hypothetical protein
MSSILDNRGSRLDIKAYQDLQLNRALECENELTGAPISFTGSTPILQVYSDMNMRNKVLSKELEVTSNVIDLSITDAEMKGLSAGNYYYRIILQQEDLGLLPFLYGSLNVVNN